ncbi:hypothetical protein ATCC90586_012095 [Pythium insidiosum]|nr:hypothetical protein ATCC90586_012095 [Pythium insidiosum]
MKDGEVLLNAEKCGLSYKFYSFPAGVTLAENVTRTADVIVNYTTTDGVASLKVWHERLAHTCTQYVKLMADRAMVDGMLVTRREHTACDACHLGKQRAKKHHKKLDRTVSAPNQIVYADLMFPSKSNGTRFSAVLVIMDAYSRFLTVHLLTSKKASVVNALMKQYVLWAERHAGRGIRRIVQREVLDDKGLEYPVEQVLTDKGREFVNGEMDDWYKSRGIEHIKNRVYCKAAGAVPYTKMFGIKPDIHHIRKFGALAYVHVPDTPDRRREMHNAKIGYLLGYVEDVVGCLVYFPGELEIDGAMDEDDDEQDEDVSMNDGVDDPTVDNDDRAVGAGAQDTVV